MQLKTQSAITEILWMLGFFNSWDAVASCFIFFAFFFFLINVILNYF